MQWIKVGVVMVSTNQNAGKLSTDAYFSSFKWCIIVFFIALQKLHA